MKVKFILLLFVLATSSVWAQYESLFNMGKKWCFIYESGTGSFSDSVEYKDTVNIDGKLYNRQEYSDFQLYRSNFYREDTTTGKVWMYDDCETYKEHLIMDMSLEKGDTIIVDPRIYYKYYFDTIAVIDTVYYKNGRRIQVTDLFIETPYRNGQEIPLIFIEGIGPNNGLINPSCGEFKGFLTCVYQNDSLIFCDLELKCKCIFNFIDKIKDMEENDYVIISSDKNLITVKNISFDDVEIKVSTILGDILFNKTIAPKSLININTGKYKKGLYICMFENKKTKKTFTQKLIKN